MRLPLRLIFIVALLLPAIVRAELPDFHSVFSELASKVRVHILPNGLRVIVYRRGFAPVFSGVVAVRVGGSDEPSGRSGIAHLLEHMAFKGTPEIGTRDYGREKQLLAELEEIASHPLPDGSMTPGQQARWKVIHEELGKLWVSEQFTREYEKRGATGLNATTDTEMTKYFVNLPRSALEFWCYLESERIMHTVLRQFYQERDVVLEERRTRYDDDPDGKLYELLLGTVFRVHPYQNPVIGYSGDVRRLTATTLNEFHRKYYVPSNIVLALVGDIDPETDIQVVERYFGRIPSGPLPERPHAKEPEQEGERTVILEARSSPQLLIAYRKPQYPHPDDPSISVMLQILAGSKVSPLYTQLVKDRQVATSVSESEGPGVAYPDNFMLFSITPRTPFSGQDNQEVFDQVIKSFRRNGTKEESLELAKRAIAVEYLGELKSNLSLALNFATAQLIYNDWNASLDWFQKAMAVSLADIKRVANQYLVERGRTIAEVRTKKQSGVNR